MNKILGWQLAEITQLLNLVDTKKGNKRAVFNDFAHLTGRKTNSVRNFYYKFLSLVKEKDDLREWIENNKDVSYHENPNLSLDNNSEKVVKLNGEISNADIESLFWGLVRLVKRKSETEIENKVRQELEFKTDKLESVRADLKRKELLLKELKQQNENLRSRLNEIHNLNELNNKTIAENFTYINECVKSNNMEKLRLILKEITNKVNQNET